MPTRRLKVAICGGGIAGVCLASALSKYPHIDAHVYEGGSSIRESGAGMGVAGNAQTALRLIRPELHAALGRAGASTMDPSFRFVLAQGERAGEHVCDVRLETPELALSRGLLLEQFVKTVPAGVLHTDKKLVGVEEAADGRLTLRFGDGVVEVVDALVGTDGINSYTRSFVLSREDPSLEAVFSGVSLLFNIVSMEQARETIGEAHTSGSCLTGYLGEGGYLMNVPVGDKMMVLAQEIADDKNEKVERVSSGTPADLEKRYRSWGSLAKPIIGLLSQNPDLVKRAIMEHRNTTTFARGNVCMLGDSAHAMPPWVGAGAAMAIEDVLVLERLLAKATSLEDVAPAFQAYDKTRRPRTQAVAEASRRLGRLLTGTEPGVGFSLESLRKLIPAQWSWVSDVDLEAHVREAEDTFTALRGDVPRT